MTPVFTGSDLRDWIAEETEGEAVELDVLFDRTPGASWESAAKWLRDAIEDPVQMIDDSSEAMELVFGAYVGGVCDVSLALWGQRAQEAATK